MKTLGKTRLKIDDIVTNTRTWRLTGVIDIGSRNYTETDKRVDIVTLFRSSSV